MENHNVIYKITNTLTGKCYIGKAKNFKKRIKQHKQEVLKKKTPLYSAIKSHGWDQFTVDIVCVADSYEELDLLEVELIQEYNSLYPNGYNLTKGGTGGDVATHHPNKIHLYDTRKNRTPWNKGLKGTQTAWNKGTKGVMKPNKTTFKAGEEHPMYGKKQPVETVAKRRAKMDYKKIFENFPWEQKAKKCMKPIFQCTQDGTVIREWESATTVSKELIIAKHLVFQHLDKQKLLLGFLWKRKK